MRRSGSAAPHSSWSPHRERAEVFAAHRELAQAADRESRACPVTAAGVRSRTLSSRVVGDDAAPSRCAPASIRSISASGTSRLQLDRQRLAVAAHRADAHAERVDRNRRLPGRRGRGSCSSRRRPSTPRGSCRCPGPCRSTGSGCRRAARRSARSGKRSSRRMPATSRSMSRIADAGSSSSVLRGEVRLAHLLQQLAHVLRARAGRRLVGHARHPFDEVAPGSRPASAHQHQADRAVAADVVASRPARARRRSRRG